MFRLSRAAALAATLALAVGGMAACGSSDNDESAGEGGGGGGGEPVQVGAIVDLTGPTASVQMPFWHGIQAFVKQTNDAGGANGHQIELTVEDEKYEVQPALVAYKKLVTQDKVDALVGSLNQSSFQVAALKLLERDKVPVIGAQSTTLEALKTASPYFFAMQCSYVDQSDVAVPYMAEKTGVEAPRVAVVSLDVASGFEWADLIKARVEEDGGTFVGHYTLPPTATEADAAIQKVADQDVDYIALHGSSSTAIIVLKSMQKFGLDKMPMIGIFATGGANVYEAAPDAVAKNFETLNCYTSTDVEEPGTPDLIAAAKKYGFEEDVPNTNFVTGWVVGQALVAGIENAGDEISRESIIAGMEKVTDLDTGGLSAPVQFGPDRRTGVQLVRPYAFDYDINKVVAVGSYEDYAKYISNKFVAEK